MAVEKKTNEKYSKSFLAKVIQSDEQTKRYYSALKNELLSYQGVKCSVDWRWECFSAGKKTLARLRLRGKNLWICLALNAEDYLGSRYDVENNADVKSLADTPCAYLIKDYKRLMYAKQLIGVLMGKNGIAKTSAEEIDYVAQYPYETNEALIKKKLIKISSDEDALSAEEVAPDEIRESSSQDEVKESSTVPASSKPKQSALPKKADTHAKAEDAAPTKQSNAAPASSKPKQSASPKKADTHAKAEAAAAMKKSNAASEGGKSAIVNIDTLSQCFAAGETVTLSEIKQRVKGFDKRAASIKVLARGTLDKPLAVEADRFSLKAVKLIGLAGGTAIKKGASEK